MRMLCLLGEVGSRQCKARRRTGAAAAGAAEERAEEATVAATGAVKVVAVEAELAGCRSAEA